MKGISFNIAGAENGRGGNPATFYKADLREAVGRADKEAALMEEKIFDYRGDC